MCGGRAADGNETLFTAWCCPRTFVCRKLLCSGWNLSAKTIDSLKWSEKWGKAMPISTSIVTQHVSMKYPSVHYKQTPPFTSKSLLLKSGSQLGTTWGAVKKEESQAPQTPPQTYWIRIIILIRSPGNSLVLLKFKEYCSKRMLCLAPHYLGLYLYNIRDIWSFWWKIKKQTKTVELAIKHYVNPTISSAFSTFHLPSFKTLLAFYISYSGCEQPRWIQSHSSSSGPGRGTLGVPDLGCSWFENQALSLYWLHRTGITWPW